MLFKQISYEPDGCASYLIGCGRAKEAVVIDPLASVGLEEYLMEAADRGLTITHVIDTHTHADHVSIGRSLAATVGAPYHLNRNAGALVRYPFEALADGDEIRIGQVSLKVIETPGHTPDSMCLLVTDHSRSEEPWFLLTGDTLFVGDVGRPDLLVGDRELDVWETRERAERLFESLNRRILTLPDHVEIFPGHFGGSSCGGVNMSGKAFSTIRFEKRWNPALQKRSSHEFTEFVLSTLRPLPRDYQTIKRRNLGLEVA